MIAACRKIQALRGGLGGENTKLESADGFVRHAKRVVSLGGYLMKKGVVVWQM